MKAKRLFGIFGLLAFVLLISCSKSEDKPKPTASFTASKTAVLVGEQITFTNACENATSFTWSFGDGTTSTQASPTKTYESTGTFTVSVVATGAGGTATFSMDITVTAMSIYFIDPSDEKIAKITLDAAKTVTTVKDIPSAGGVGLAYDAAGDKIYFSDFYTADPPEGKIWKMNGDGSGAAAIVTGLLDPYGIALDVAGGKIYWADDAGNISRSGLDGSGQELGLINIPEGMMRAVAIDKAHNKMFFYEVNLENLYVANLDGTEATVLIPGVYGYVIFIDTAHGKIYFDDQNSGTGGKLRRANLDGSSIEDIDDAETRIYGVDIDYDNSKLYWSARDLGEIYCADLNGANKVTVKSGLSSPRGIFLKK